MRLPAGLLAYAARGPAWAQWLDRLPALLRELQGEWQLAVDGEAAFGHTAVVLPVRTTSRRPAALKVGFPHEESEQEHLALQHWHGRGAVELLRADPHRAALLLERLSTEDLGEQWDLEACEVVAGLYGRLHVPAPPRLRSLAAYVERWSAPLRDLPRGGPVPHRLVEQAVALARDLVADPATVGTLVHGDLHYANVLAGEREPWLAIDPKPVSGDPHYEPGPMLWNRWEDVVASAGVRDAVRRRFHTLVDAAGLDEDRARDWVVVRAVLSAHWMVEEAAGRDLDRDQRDWVTRCITVAKAVQD